MTKTARQRRIVELLQVNRVTSQTMLVELLGNNGASATQATVSRDLEELGAVKVRLPCGELVYAIPERPHEQVAPADQLRRVLGEWVAEVNASANLVVVKTPPGSAHVVVSAIDRAGLDGLLGTVAGDDTILVITASATGGNQVAKKLSELAGLEKAQGA